MNANRILTFDRWDFLWTKALVVAAGLLVPFFAVVLPTAMWIQDEPLEWAGPTGQDEQVRSADAIANSGVEAHWTDEAAVTITDAPTDVWVASLLPGFVISLATLCICWFLYQLITRIQREKEFTRASVWALRGIALALFVGGSIYTVVAGVADEVVMSHAVEGPQTPLITISLGGTLIAFASAMIIAAIAEAFAHGVNIQQDVEGLV